MMVKEVKEFLKVKKRADLGTISSTLKIDGIMAEHALKLLIKKGIVKEEKIEMPCNSCDCGGTCKDLTAYIYQTE